MGLLAYDKAWQVQEALWQARRNAACPDTLLVLEHLPVVTLGQSGGEEDLLVPVAFLRSQGVDFCRTNRGGRATFHGPGQIVIYPIMKLVDRDLHAYLWKLEESILHVLAAWGLDAVRMEAYPGVWVGGQKIAAVGVAVREDVTMHGLALNVNVDLDYFKLITPCGIRERGVTSMQAAIGPHVAMEAVKEQFMLAFANVFCRPVVPRSCSQT